MDVIILSEYLPGGTMMKFLLAITIGLTIGVLVTTAVETRAVSYIDHDQVGLKLAKGGTMVSTPTYVVLGSHRDKEGQVEVHDKETDVFYVTDGQATFLTGGTMIGGKQTSPNQSLGTDMKGGQSHSLSKGDVIVIPAGTPHWFKNVPDHINYFVVKVIQP
jgi:mannose-6-phosphate isomerase-like protein (cupin superfamily)